MTPGKQFGTSGEKLTIAVDFDGTLVYRRYPEVGNPIPGAIRVCKRLVHHGHKLILWTCRTGKQLEEAVAKVEEMGIPLHAVNENLPTDAFGPNDPKVWAHLYIDDAALGAPTSKEPVYDRHFVSWWKVERMLMERRIIPWGNDDD